MKRILYAFITAKQPGFFTTLFRILLTPFSWLYGIIVWIRNFCFNVGWYKQEKLPCSVISIGNIVVGGTGKTPAVASIARLLRDTDYKVAVLLRGYGRKSKKAISIVSDGENRLCTRMESGDEADLLARQLTDIPIVVGKNRFLAGRATLDQFQSSIIILDDGFQHRQLARDIDILTIDVTQPYGTGALLPTGTLREPISSIQRADIILLTRTDVPNIQIDDLIDKLQRLFPRTPIFKSIHQPKSLYWLNNPNNTTNTSQSIPINDLNGKNILAVCGIGNPTAFVATLEEQGPDKVKLLAFPDHHVYTESDHLKIEQKMKLVDAEWVVTTQKDEQKLKSLSKRIPVLVLKVELVFTNGEEEDLLKALQI